MLPIYSTDEQFHADTSKRPPMPKNKQFTTIICNRARADSNSIKAWLNSEGGDAHRRVFLYIIRM